MRDDLGIRLAGELDPLRLQCGAQFAVVFDDAVVDDGNPSAPVGMRMGIAVIGRSMGRPSGMPDAGPPAHRTSRELLLQVLDPPGLLGDLQRAIAVYDGDASRVVSPVFE